jgi:RTX calcium-binding nonapeptide repeat (4 copies)
MLRRKALGGLVASAVALLTLTFATGASAEDRVTLRPVSTSLFDLMIENPSLFEDRWAAVTRELNPGHPDLILGDPSAATVGPIPSPCVSVSANTFRCPAAELQSIIFDLGPGNDTFSAAQIERSMAPNLARIKVVLGSGNDEAVGGPVPNVIFGGAGRDLIMGGPLGDKLFGGGGNDFLVGQEGNDLFQCGKGRHDLFNDGPGKDLVNVRACERRVHREFVP